MTDVDNALADLGLDTAAPTAGAAADAPARAPREEVEIGDIEFGTTDLIPTMKRGGDKGSKYQFDKLAAPVAKDGGGYSYSTFSVSVMPGVDPDKLRRSVQSATTAANRASKADGSVAYYITRSRLVAGEFAGMTVFRVDGTLGKDAE
ncbi:hypothetical protein [Nostoc phage NMeng1]|nr:hypothetical protein [Nostoc phage NMeng1]